ncbi:MAG: erythromycin esterase family protein [Theionarchaea archaeon]|nr:erythromycin esterase family protein [Theionarchaea archaeon]
MLDVFETPEEPMEPPQNFNELLQRNAIPFTTTEPGSGFEDLMPLKEVIGDARIVALGEATHGTHEFFEMKHRLTEFLVEEMGFTIFAMEAGCGECTAIDGYVRTGRGDPKVLLRNTNYWVWNTEEVLTMIQWMRQHNESSDSAAQVNFFGFDMRSSE